jgi:peptide/nickel transport system ATP-binding protein
MTPGGLEVEDLRVEYRLRGALVRRGRQARIKVAVDSASLVVRPGELVSLVGESGSGKTTLGMAIMGLRTVVAGRVRIDGGSPAGGGRRAAREIARKVQFLFQNPYDSLDPGWRVRDIVEEPLRIQGSPMSKTERRAAVDRALERVSLSPPGDFTSRLPEELSGGQRQRVAIAAALVCKPRIVIADEPVSMLDATVRSSILRLLKGLCSDGLAVLMITHDLSTAAFYSDRILVMKEGRIVEQGEALALCRSPRHPYTRTLLAAVPHLPARRT